MDQHTSSPATRAEHTHTLSLATSCASIPGHTCEKPVFTLTGFTVWG